VSSSSFYLTNFFLPSDFLNNVKGSQEIKQLWYAKLLKASCN
jgi:hypothetical protein